MLIIEVYAQAAVLICIAGYVSSAQGLRQTKASCFISEGQHQIRFFF